MAGRGREAEEDEDRVDTEGLKRSPSGSGVVEGGSGYSELHTKTISSRLLMMHTVIYDSILHN